MTKRVFYEKINGEYVPVSEHDSDLIDSLVQGNHLIMCYPGGQTHKYNVEPALAPMIAAGRYAMDAMVRAMHEKSQARPSTTLLTERQQQAWKEMQASLDDGLFYLQYNSNFDVAQAGIDAMCQQAEKLLTHASVREAYEHFLFLAKLVNRADNSTKV